MKCRRIKEEGKSRTIVWFGSYGINDDGTAKFYNNENKHDNYADGAIGVRDSLVQRLSVIRSELWYNISYGLPLFEKSKIAIDAAISTIVMSHPDVKSILNFKSITENHKYVCDLSILTTFGVIDISI